MLVSLQVFLSHTHTRSLNSQFSETGAGKHVPRAIFLDLEREYMLLWLSECLPAPLRCVCVLLVPLRLSLRSSLTFPPHGALPYLKFSYGRG